MGGNGNGNLLAEAATAALLAQQNQELQEHKVASQKQQEEQANSSQNPSSTMVGTTSCELAGMPLFSRRQVSCYSRAFL